MLLKSLYPRSTVKTATTHAHSLDCYQFLPSTASFSSISNTIQQQFHTFSYPRHHTSSAYNNRTLSSTRHHHASLSLSLSSIPSSLSTLQCRSFAAIPSSSKFLEGPYIGSALPQIDASKLTITRTLKKRPKLPAVELKFGQLMSDHMLSIDWDYLSGWHSPEIIPYQPLALDPAASVLHYALELFEGLKAYIDRDGHIRMFRPEKNMDRLNRSAHRLLLPGIGGGEEVIKCIIELLKLDKDWIPTEDGYSLYIRPTLISTHPYIGVAPSQSAKLYVITSPVGPYYPTGFDPIAVYCESKYARAWPGGTGDAKIGGNYAITIRPAYEASMKGYSQILWLVGSQHNVSEVGTMNMFFYWVNKETGKKELITAPLDGTILPGITRMSVLELCRDWNEFQVSERTYTIYDVLDAIKDGRMIEAFGAGTAAVVSPVNRIAFEDKDYAIPLDKDDKNAKAGKLARRIWDTLTNIQYGRKQYKNWSRVVD